MNFFMSSLFCWVPMWTPAARYFLYGDERFF